MLLKKTHYYELLKDVPTDEIGRIDCGKCEYLLRSDYYERLVVACEKNEAEVSCGSILRVRKNYQKYRIKYTEEKVYTKSQLKNFSQFFGE